MRNRIAILLAFVAGALVTQFHAPTVSAAPPGSTTTFTISVAGQKNYLSRHEPVAKKVARLQAKVAGATAAVTKHTSARDAAAAKARAGLVNEVPGLDALMPALITDIALGYTDANSNKVRDSGEDDVVRMWLNADAATNRASPPAGIVSGP